MNRPKAVSVLLSIAAMTLFTGSGIANPSESNAHAIPDGPWAVAEGAANGIPLIRRLNAGLKAGDPRFPVRAIFGFHFAHPDPNGMPDDADISEAQRVEDQLDSLTTKKRLGALACIQTSRGLRKFLVYVKSTDVAKTTLTILQANQRYEIDLTTTPDPGSQLYTKLRSETESFSARR